MHWLFEPGLWSNAAVRTGMGVGVAVAVVSALVGLFTVMRSQSFAGHALADVAMAGGAGAGVLGCLTSGGFRPGITRRSGGDGSDRGRTRATARRRDRRGPGRGDWTLGALLVSHHAVFFEHRFDAVDFVRLTL